jgi:hypothetical protein
MQALSTAAACVEAYASALRLSRRLPGRPYERLTLRAMMEHMEESHLVAAETASMARVKARPWRSER